MRYIGNGFGVRSDTLKDIEHNHLPQQYKFSRKEIGIDTSCNGSKLFIAIPAASRVILVSAHSDRYDVLDFLLKKHNHL